MGSHGTFIPRYTQKQQRIKYILHILIPYSSDVQVIDPKQDGRTMAPGQSGRYDK